MNPNNNVMQQQQQQQQAGMFSAHNQVELMLNGLMASQFTKIISSDTDFTIKKMAGALLVLSLDEVLTAVKSLIRQACEYVRQNHQVLWQHLLQLSPTELGYTVLQFLRKLILWPLGKKSDLRLNESIDSHINEKSMTMTLEMDISFHNHFLMTLVRLLLEEKQESQSLIVPRIFHGTFQRLNKRSIDIKDKNSILVTETWINVTLKFRDLEILLQDDLTIVQNQNKGKDHHADITSVYFAKRIIMDTTSVKTFTDLLPESLPNIKAHIIKHSQERKFINSDRYQTLSQWDLNPDSWKIQPYECGIIRLLHCYFPNLDCYQSLTEFSYFVRYAEFLGVFSGSSTHEYYSLLTLWIQKTKKLIIFDHVIPIKESDIRFLASKTCFYVYKDISSSSFTNEHIAEFNNAFVKYYSSLKNTSFCSTTDSIKDKDHHSKVFLHCSTPNITPTMMVDEFRDLLSCINSEQHTSKNTIQGLVAVNLIRLVKKKTVTSRPNPLYLQFLEHKKQETTETSEKKEKEKHNELFQQEPEREIMEIQIDVSVVTETKNHQRKTFDTLYLREQDMNQLKQAMDLFLNQKETMRDLGLPDKFSALLYGFPGCGKSSSIYAIASYIEQSINYVDLSGVETNQDLQMIFDHVNKHSGGGIIVIEEIEKQIDIVLKSHNPHHPDLVKFGVASDKPENPVTLSYLLNILQGCLTTDGQILLCTTNYIDDLAPEFYRDGRFDVKIEMKPCDRHQISQIFYKFTKRKLDPVLLQQIPNDKFTPATIIQRLAQFLFQENTSDEERMRPFLLSCPENCNETSSEESWSQVSDE